MFTEFYFVVLSLFGSIKKTSVEVTKEEEVPQPEELVYKQFFHSLSVGFATPTFRLEILPLLKIRPGPTWISDQELCSKVREIMSREEEST